jgi:hypothetical protein
LCSSSSCVHLCSHSNSNIVLQSSLDAACGHAGGSLIRADATAARSLDKMAIDATDVAQDRHTHTDTETDTEENTRETERDTGRHRETERETQETREGRDGLIPKKSPPKNLYTKIEGP